jgi:hypothetical protein
MTARAPKFPMNRGSPTNNPVPPFQSPILPMPLRDLANATRIGSTLVMRPVYSWPHTVPPRGSFEGLLGGLVIRR